MNETYGLVPNSNSHLKFSVMSQFSYITDRARDLTELGQEAERRTAWNLNCQSGAPALYRAPRILTFVPLVDSTALGSLSGRSEVNAGVPHLQAFDQIACAFDSGL
jgi:hypothetical protein